MLINQGRFVQSLNVTATPQEEKPLRVTQLNELRQMVKADSIETQPLDHVAQRKKLIQIADQAPSQVRADGGEISQADLGQTEGAVTRLETSNKERMDLIKGVVGFL